MAAKLVIEVRSSSSHPEEKFQVAEIGELTEDLTEILFAYGLTLDAIQLENLKDL